MQKLANPSVLQDLLSEAGVGKKQNSKSYILTCPRCGKKDKLYIRKSDGRFACWVCKDRDGFQGRPEFALAELTSRSLSELKQILYGGEELVGQCFLDVQLTDFFEDSESVPTSIKDLVEVVAHPDFRAIDSQWSTEGRKYLESRGISLELALEYKIQYWPAKSRVVFPVYSRGRLLGWQSRTIKPNEFIDEDGDLIKFPKALTYEGLEKDKALMFVDRIVGEHAVLCEGPMDALKAHLCGGNVASLGKAVSQTQLNLLINSGISKLYVALDPDASPEVSNIVKRLAGQIAIYDMRAPSGTDLGAMNLEEVKVLFDRAPEVNAANLFIYLRK